jgi:hypothetical protein
MTPAKRRVSRRLALVQCGAGLLRELRHDLRPEVPADVSPACNSMRSGSSKSLSIEQDGSAPPLSALIDSGLASGRVGHPPSKKRVLAPSGRCPIWFCEAKIPGGNP